jgi:hypothetical protein
MRDDQPGARVFGFGFARIRIDKAPMGLQRKLMYFRALRYAV